MWSGLIEKEEMGVIIAAKNDFVCAEVTELQTECEITWMKMGVAGCKTLYICIYYKPHKEDSNSFETNILHVNSSKQALGKDYL